MSAAPLPIIPVIDLREGGPPRGAVEGRERARALRDDCLSWLPGSARSALPLLDGVTRRWLSRSASDYVGEIEAVAATLGFPGIWFLNGCYQWGCTSLAREEGGAPWLARTLDWPFPGLGRHLQVARMQGQAGSFDNVCWPGYVGVLTASAPGRFAAAINQAPMKRRTHALRRGAPAAGNHTDRASGDLHPRRLPARRALRHRTHRRELFDAGRAYRLGQRLAGEQAALGGAHAHRPIAQQELRGSRRKQPQPAGEACRMVGKVCRRRFRLGRPAGAQSDDAAGR
jgi:hypothetical protein